MTNLFNDIYSAIVSRYKLIDNLRIYSALRFLIRWTANVILPIVYHLNQHKSAYQLPTCKKTSGRIIVSLTSFPKRIQHVHLAIESIMRGEVKPDKIILWLSREQFDGTNSLPKSLLALQQRGLEIHCVDGNIRSYKKFVYTLQTYTTDILVTADDDIFYRTDWLKELMSWHEQYPEDVISNYTFDIRYDQQGKRLPYRMWNNNVRQGNHLFFGSGGGVLFPTGSLPEESTNMQVAMSVCPNADDIWLNAMVHMNGRTIRRTNYYSIILPVLTIGDERLANTNIETGNDKQLDAIERYYKQKIF